MCDENGLFAEPEVSDGMLVSKRKFKRNWRRPLLSLKDRIEVALEQRDFGPIAALVYVLLGMLLGMLLFLLILNGVVSLYRLLEISRPLVLPLGGWNEP
ncbi:hypothetical protein [Methylophilus sp. 3sh_L]|uniref:hypothetical protein n=1 Tax=Methylophilus sp. 3sh_L TaxID=3377114 RepID=UPI00398ECF76